MNTTPSQPPHALPRSATRRPIAPRRRSSASPDSPTWRKVLGETASIVDAPAFFGPPVVSVVGPWLLLVLVLIGPLALILTALLAVAVAVGVLVTFAAIIASPYVLIRQLHAHGAVHARPLAPLHLYRKHRVSSGRLGSLQPKGVS